MQLKYYHKMDNKKGSKLHSIIEKLSEQCIRVSPTQDFNDEDQQIVIVTAQPPKQRTRKRRGKVNSSKRGSKTTKTGQRAKQLLTNYKKSSSRNQDIKDSFQPVDEDLCIDVNALMSIVPQMQDIDIINVADNSLPFDKGTCRICFKPAKSKKDFLVHLRETHPDYFKKVKGNHSNSQEDNEITDSEEQDKDQNDDGEEEDIEEEIEEESDDNHSDTDPDFDLDDDSDDSDVSSEDVAMPSSNRKRRSARIKAMKGFEVAEANESDDSEMCRNDTHVDESDLHIDVEKFINTSPKLDDIDLPKTKEFTCKLCEEKYYFKIELDNHMEEFHPDSADSADNNNQSSLDCEHCSRKFLNKKGLWVHIKKIVKKIERKEENKEEKRKRKEKENTCKHCGKICKTYASLKKHYTTHSDERPFKCDICDRAFKDKSYVYRHKKTHTGIKKYECNYCKKFFAHRGSLRTHIMLHTGERPYKCQYCETGFINKFDLKVHENKHTGNMPYKCTHCTKSFPKANNLKMHLISHSTEKPFPCEVCGKAFKRRDHLRYHLIIHSDNKPYKCDTCNKTFNQHICLRKHLPCRELEKSEKRAIKPKENNPQKLQKLAKKSHKNKQISNPSTSTNMSSNQENQQNLNTTINIQVEGNRVPEQPITYLNDSSAAERQQQNNDIETHPTEKQAQAKNTNVCLSSTVVNSATSKGKSYNAASCDSTSDIIDPIFSSVRQSHDSGLRLSSLRSSRSSSNSTVLQCAKESSFNINKLEFSNEFRIPGHAASRLPMSSFTQPPTLTGTCVYTSTMQRPFIPFNCSSQSASGMDYEGGGLELDSLPADGSHGNMLGNRPFPHETPSELSSALLAAMDPDNLSAMVDSTSAFFPPT